MKQQISILFMVTVFVLSLGLNLQAQNLQHLFSAIKNNNYDSVKILISQGVDVNAKNDDGLTPLMLACYTDTKGNIVKLLIDKGADVNTKDNDGETPLLYACANDTTGNIVKLLIDNGADVNAKDNDGDTPLMFACYKDTKGNIVKLLLDKGADVNVKNNDGLTPLMVACAYNKNDKIVKSLLDHGADVNTNDNDGWTPLMYAAKYNSNPAIYELLKLKGADINATNNEGKTALDYLSKNQDIKNTVPDLPEEDEEPLIIAEQMPEFPGGELALRTFIAEHIQYPPEAMKKGIEGKVYVRFVVEKDGSVGDVQVIREIDPLLDQEAVRVIKSLPKFKPGYQGGKPVPVWYSVPIVFKLSD